MCTNDSNSGRGSKTSSPLCLPSNNRLRRDECALGIHQNTTGEQMIGMHLCGSHRLGSVGMLWIRRLILRPFGTSPMPLGPFVLQPYFDAFGQRLLWSSSFASAQGLATQLKQETPIPPFAIG